MTQGPWHASHQNSLSSVGLGPWAGRIDGRGPCHGPHDGRTHGKEAWTYWSLLQSRPPQDGSPPQLRKGCPLPQEVIVEEQGPLLLSLGPGRGGPW